MKKIISMIILAAMMFSFCTYAEEEEKPAAKLIIPQITEDKRVIYHDDFEEGFVEGDDGWKYTDAAPPPAVEPCEDEDNTSKILAVRGYCYYRKSSYLSEYVVEFNAKMERYNMWPGIYFHAKGGKPGQVYITDDGMSIVAEQPGGGYVCGADFDFNKFKNKWMYFKFVITSESIALYVNDEDTPLCSGESEILRDTGAIAFKAEGGGMYIDNFLVSKIKKEISSVNEKEKGYENIVYDTFENADSSVFTSESGASGEMFDDGIYHVYSVADTDSPSEESLAWKRNYTAEFNFKMDYTDGNENYGAAMPGVKFRNDGNTYYFVRLSTKGNGSIELVRSVNGSEAVLTTKEVNIADENNVWCYMKIEVYKNTINVYYLKSDNLVLSYEDKSENAPYIGTISFVKDLAAKFYISNLAIREKIPSEEYIGINKDEANNNIAFFDFESDVQGWTGDAFAENGVWHVKGTNWYKDDIGNFTMEFNVKNDFRPYNTAHENEMSVFFRENDGNHYEIRWVTENGKNRIILYRNTSARRSYKTNIIDNDREWVYCRIEAVKGKIKLYYGSHDEPVIDYTDVMPINAKGGKIGIKGAANTLIDDLYIHGADKKIEIKNAEISRNENVYTVKAEALSRFSEKKTVYMIVTAQQNGIIKYSAVKPTVLAGNGAVTGISAALETDGGEYDVCVYFTDDFKRLMPIAPYIMNENTVSGAAEKISGDFTAKAEIEEKNIKISADYEANKFKTVLVLITRTGTEPESITAETFSPRTVLSIRQLEEKKSGFSELFSLGDTPTEGIYTAALGGDSDIGYLKLPVYYVDKERYETFKNEINKENLTGDELKETLAKPENRALAEKMGFNMSEYEKLSDTLKSDCCRTAAELRSESFTEANAKGIFDKALSLPIVKMCASAQTLAEVLENKADILCMDKDKRALYDSFDKDKKLLVCGGVMTRIAECNSFEDFETVFSENSVLTLIYKSNYSEIEEIIKKYNDILKLDLSKMETLKKKSGEAFETALKKLNESRTYSAEAFKQIYDSAMKNTSSTPVTPSGSSGGGGGGGKKSTGTTTLPIQPVKNDTNGEQTKFLDFENGHWAYEAVNALIAKGIVSGYPDNTFKPDDKVSRAEFVKMAAAAFGLQSDTQAEFKDVEKGHWCEKYISAAVSSGAVNGTGDGMFSPDAYITREDAAVIIYRLSDITAEEGNLNDSESISAYAREGVLKLVGGGIISGDENGYFKPADYMTRAEAAQLIYKAALR